MNKDDAYDDLFYYHDYSFYEEDYPEQEPYEVSDWRETDFLSPEELDWARNRQDEWYELLRKECNLSDDEYVDDQDLLDWLAAKFNISRTVHQEI